MQERGVEVMYNNISHELHEKHMTQADLAKKVGVKREYINRIINSKVTPTIPLGMRIAHALDMPMEKLFFLEH